jgi:hypothetical protein
MFAGRNRKSAMRREVPLTRCASGQGPVGIVHTGIGPAAAVLRHLSTTVSLPSFVAEAVVAERGVNVERPQRSEDERR